MKSIQLISENSVHRICSGQVVLNLATAVKELVENSIDAGASLVEIKLHDFGLERIEVSDNGSGVDESNFQALTAKYHTSKLRDYIDLEGMTTFGFRGEALSSLCALSNMTITTRHIAAEFGTRLELDHNGGIQKQSICARQVGTTIALTHLFATLPVRKREFTKNVKKEFARMCQVLQAYCLVSVGVRIMCTNQNSKGVKSTVMATNGSKTVLDNITAIFGAKQSSDLLRIKDTTDDAVADAGAEPTFHIDGWISSCKHGAGRSAKDRQFFYINARPCEPKQITKVINEKYHHYNMHQYPFVFLNVLLPRRDVDVNLTPDKRQVLVNNENALLEVLRQSLELTFVDVPSTFTIQNLNLSSVDPIVGQEDVSQTESIDGNKTGSFLSALTQWKATGHTDGHSEIRANKKRTSDRSEGDIEETMKFKRIHEFFTKIESNDNDEEFVSSNATASTLQEIDVLSNAEVFDFNDAEEVPNAESTLKGACGTCSSSSLSLPQPQLASPADTDFRITCKNIESKPEQTLRTERINCQSMVETKEHASVIFESIERTKPTDGKQSSNSVSIKTSIEAIKKLMDDERLMKEANAKRVNLDRLKFKAAIDPAKNAAAQAELHAEIRKTDFVRMHVVGQFNLGFIVVRLDDDLFIVDQHATDEKYNFEQLKRTTVLQNQPMIRPQPLLLTAVNEMILIDNKDIFELNGFMVKIDESAEPTKKCQLLAKPFSKNWEFGREDIDELLFMLQDSPNTMCRPSRIQSMLASRACRMSVMIGTALSARKMRRLIDQMSEIDHPWNCPHGRPTMRHLVNLAMLNEQNS